MTTPIASPRQHAAPSLPDRAADPATLTVSSRARRQRIGWTLALLVLLIMVVLLSVAVGSRAVSSAELLGALRGQVETLGEAAVISRIPRTLLAVIAGGALGLAGGVMQGLTRNPLADPGLLGVNSGAALAVVIGLAWFGMESVEEYVWSAIVGAAISAAGVYAIAGLGRGGATPLRLALAGAALSAALGSLTTAVVLPRGDIAGLVQSWLVGGVGGATFDQVIPVLPFLAVGAMTALLCARKLNLLALGDDTATGLGERVAWARGLSALAAILLCGATTAVCGPIGFVGLVVPHACRLLVGSDYRWLLPFSALGGAVLLTLADVVGRVVAQPSELDVGILTAFVGAPVFIAIVRRRKIASL